MPIRRRWTPSRWDGGSGKLIWRFHSGVKAGGPQRGLAMWTHGHQRRLFANAGSYLYALDPATGKPLADFGSGGRIDLREGLDRDPGAISVALTGPGLIWRDMIVDGFSHRRKRAGRARRYPRL